MDAILLDGAAVINMLTPGAANTFREHSELIFLPYIESQLRKASRVDIVWDEYLKDSLKANARGKRGKGTRRRVQPNTKIPTDWAAFLRIDENKVELFAFLSQQSITISTEGKIIATAGRLAHVPTRKQTRGYCCS